MIPWNTCRSIGQLMDWMLAHQGCGYTGEKDTKTTQFSLKNTHQTHKKLFPKSDETRQIDKPQDSP